MAKPPNPRCRKWSNACCNCLACLAKTPQTPWAWPSPTPRSAAPPPPSTKWPRCRPAPTPRTRRGAATEGAPPSGDALQLLQAKKRQGGDQRPFQDDQTPTAKRGFARAQVKHKAQGGTAQQKKGQETEHQHGLTTPWPTGQTPQGPCYRAQKTRFRRRRAGPARP